MIVKSASNCNASVPPASTAYCNIETELSFFCIQREEIIHHFVEHLQKVACGAGTEDIILHRFIHAGHGSQVIDVERVRQETDIENKIRVCRNTEFISERYYIDCYGFFLPVFGKNTLKPVLEHS